MNLLTLLLCMSALCCAAVCVSAQQYVRSDTTSTGRYSLLLYGHTWNGAYKSCRDSQSHLAVINSQEEADNLKMLMENYGLNSIHVGVSDKYQPGKYVSILDQDVENMGYNIWRSGFPNTESGQCVGLSRAGGEVGLFNLNCNNFGYSSFCEERLWDKFELIPGHGYYSDIGNVTWLDARSSCRSKGTHLLILNSPAELQEVFTIIPAAIWTWVGVTSKLHPDVHVSLFNTPANETGFSTWCNGYPLNNTNYPYTFVFQNPECMVSEGSQMTFPTICEHELITA